MLGGVFTDMTDEDDEQMRIVFEDGTSEECSPADQRQISTVAVFDPAQRIPKNLKRVWDNPPTYANLDDRFHDSDPLQCWDLRPQNAGLSATPYDSNFGNARLVVVRCRLIVPDHYVMTDAGLKRVVSVER
jgi:hypothetical protein